MRESNLDYGTFCQEMKSRISVAKPTDAAALATAAEIGQRVYENTGDLKPTTRTWANAQAFASVNNSYLRQYGVKVVVTENSVDAGEDTVIMQASANLDRLFPSLVTEVYVVMTENSYAKIQAFTH